MENDDFNTKENEVRFQDSTELYSDEPSVPKASRSDAAQNRRRLDELLENKKLRQEVEGYDQYLGCTYYDDDIFSHYYSREDEEK